jgi:hypothetical protein
MIATRGIANAATLAGLAVGTPGTGWADPPTMNGHYIQTATTQAGFTSTYDWNATPCGDGCASIVENGNPLGQARLGNGQWTLDVPNDTATCSNGEVHPGAISTHYQWDANTLTGTVQETVKVATCGRPAGDQETTNLQLRQAP